jgi:hypothetical protein
MKVNSLSSANFVNRGGHIPAPIHSLNNWGLRIMATFKDMEDSFKKFVIQEQSDAHNTRTVSTAKYNNIKFWMDLTK